MRRALLLPIVAATLTSCGSHPAALTKAAAQSLLRADTLALTQAAAKHDTTGERAAVAKLKADLIKVAQASAVTTARLTQIAAAIAAVHRDLTLAAPVVHATSAPKPTPTPKAEPKPVPRPQPEPEHHGPGGKDHPGPHH